MDIALEDMISRLCNIKPTKNNNNNLLITNKNIDVITINKEYDTFKQSINSIKVIDNDSKLNCFNNDNFKSFNKSCNIENRVNRNRKLNIFKSLSNIVENVSNDNNCFEQLSIKGI